MLDVYKKSKNLKIVGLGVLCLAVDYEEKITGVFMIPT
jgi:hypothetical protein